MNLEENNSKVEKALRAISSELTHLRLVQDSDAQFIYDLRADALLSRHLSAAPASLHAQKEWIARYLTRHLRGMEHYFIIETSAGSVGTARMYDYDPVNGSFTWGSWIIRRGEPPARAISVMIQIYDIGFRAIGFSQAKFEVKPDNLSVLALHRRLGAIQTCQTRDSVSFRVLAAEYESKVRPRLLDLLGRAA